MKMLAFLFVFITTSTFAAEIKVLDIPAWGFKHQSSTFNVNHELKRAWVESTVKDNFNHDDRPHNRGQVYRELVPGLSFDGSVVRLDHEGQMVECATVVQRGRSIFRYNKVTLQDCSFVSREVVVLRDTGFEVIKEKRLQVFLVTK